MFTSTYFFFIHLCISLILYCPITVQTEVVLKNYLGNKNVCSHLFFIFMWIYCGKKVFTLSLLTDFRCGSAASDWLEGAEVCKEGLNKEKEDLI